MIIGFDGSRAFVKGRTGTENYSYQLLKALAKIDRKNHYVVYVRSLQNIGYKDWSGNFTFKEINWPRLWTQGGLALQTFKDHLDVLFVPAHTLPVVRKPGLKTAVTVHDLGSEYLPSMHQLKQRLYLSFMQKIQLKTATKIIAVSKATKEDLIKRIGINGQKVSVVYEGYDKTLFKPVKGDTLVDTLMHYNLKPKTYYLFVGTVQPRKNLERLIKAFARFLEAARLVAKNRSHCRNLLTSENFVDTNYLDSLPRSAQNPQLFLAGPAFAALKDSFPILVIAGSKGWMSDEIYQLPKKLGIEDKVKFLGYVPEKDLSALYSGAIAFTFPSLFEGFGLPILEAQACGCPVLTSNTSSMPEVADKGAVFVNPNSIDDIVKGMIMIKNKELRIKLIKAGLENVKKFSWEKCARETLEVLKVGC